ncbi:MAG: hypothetical protein KDB22_27940 [Planctomycetales bacterium]|nr:hypothetical protein [Planctomycetales bacterium]
MKRTLGLFRPCLASALLISVLGCSSGDMGSVTGTVHLDGKPLEGALVTFYPEIDGKDPMSGGGASMGRTDAEGNYELTYNRDEMGAQVGKHLVYIETLQESGGGDYGAGRGEEVPKRYNSQSELHVEVKPGRNTIDFLDLTSDGEKNRARRTGGY